MVWLADPPTAGLAAMRALGTSRANGSGIGSYNHKCLATTWSRQPQFTLPSLAPRWQHACSPYGLLTDGAETYTAQSTASAAVQFNTVYRPPAPPCRHPAFEGRPINAIR